MKRRELFSFLSGIFKYEERAEKEVVIRVPYFSDIDAFDKECHKCDGRCATFCQEQIIEIRKDKTPQLNFFKSGCTYCDECVKGCEFGVLTLEAKKEIDAHIFIDKSKCISHNGVMCFACKDPCLEDAIEFSGMFKPLILDDKCTKCGFCVSRCPTYAIKIEDTKVLTSGVLK